MKNLAIKAENISKQYRLGEVGTGTLSHDLNRIWYKMRGKEDPYLKIGESNDRSKKGESDYVWSLQDINFEIEQGDAVGIIGRNGAGKSTLLKILSKVTKPTTGNIKVNGRIASLLEVGTGFNPEMTGRENIYLNGAILGMRKAEITRKLDEIIDFSGVERYIDTPVKRYSSGMYVRLAFAVAAHLESEILIVDEVLAVGDVEFQKKCLGKMGNISKGEGRTVLFVSHNMGAIANLCTNCILLDKGTIHSLGDVNTVINIYSNLNNIIYTNFKEKNGITIESISAIDHNNNEFHIIENFTPFIIEIVISLEINFENLKCEFFIRDSFDEIVCTLSSWLNNEDLIIKNKKQKITCKLSEGLPFDTGTYYIDLRFFYNFIQIDYPKIRTIEIINSPIKSNVKYPLKPQIHGKVIVKNYWQLN